MEVRVVGFNLRGALLDSERAINMKNHTPNNRKNSENGKGGHQPQSFRMGGGEKLFILGRAKRWEERKQKEQITTIRGVQKRVGGLDTLVRREICFEERTEGSR